MHKDEVASSGSQLMVRSLLCQTPFQTWPRQGLEGFQNTPHTLLLATVTVGKKHQGQQSQRWLMPSLKVFLFYFGATVKSRLDANPSERRETLELFLKYPWALCIHLYSSTMLLIYSKYFPSYHFTNCPQEDHRHRKICHLESCPQ